MREMTHIGYKPAIWIVALTGVGFAVSGCDPTEVTTSAGIVSSAAGVGSFAINIKQELDRLSGQYGETSEIRRLRQENEDLKKQIQAYPDQIRSLQNQISTLETQVRSLNERLISEHDVLERQSRSDSVITEDDNTNTVPPIVVAETPDIEGNEDRSSACESDRRNDEAVDPDAQQQTENDAWNTQPSGTTQQGDDGDPVATPDRDETSY